VTVTPDDLVVMDPSAMRAWHAALALLEREDRDQRYRNDPVAWVREVLHEDVWSLQAQIMRSVVDHPRTAVQSCHGIGKCVAVGERIQLADGRVVEVSELIGRYFAVPAFLPDGRQTPALAYAADNGEQDVYRVTTDTGREIIRTGNHPLWSGVRSAKRSGKHPAVRSIGWTPVKQFQPGDLVLTPDQIHVEGNRPRPEAEVKLAGYLLGDGGTTVRIDFTQADGPAKDEFVGIVEAMGCVAALQGKYTVRVSGPIDGPTGGRYETGNNPVLNLARTWGLFGVKAKAKSFPAWVWELPNSQLALLLNRLFSCDGWAYVRPSKPHGHGQIGMALASERMIRDVELAMLRLGIPGRVRHRTMKLGDKTFGAWEWAITKVESVQRFINVVGVYGKEPQLAKVLTWSNLVNQDRTTKWRTKEAPLGYQWAVIKNVEPLGQAPTVTVSVDEHHTFVTSYVEHNSHIASRLAVWWIAVHEPGEAFLVTTAPTSSQVRAILWRYIRQAHVAGGLPGDVMQTAEWKINGELVGYGRKPADHQHSAFQGVHADRVLTILDEACGVGEHLFVAADALATNDASRTLAIGNPDDSGSHFARVCQHEPGWSRIKVSAFDSPSLTGEPVSDVLARRLVSRSWVEDKKNRWGEHNPLYIAKVLGEWADSEDGLIPLSWVRAAHARWHEWNDAVQERRQRGHGPVEPPGRRIFGVDVARFGTDLSAIATRQGHVVMRVEKWPKLDTTQVTGLVQARLRGHPQSHAVVDVVGVGAGVVDQLRRVGASVSAFNGARSTRRRDSSSEWRFSRMRSASWWNLRELLDPAMDAQLALPEDDDLTADLVTPKWEPRAGGIIHVEEKTEIKDRLGRSPDVGDAVAMACWSDTPERESELDEPAAHRYTARPEPVAPQIPVTSLNDGPPRRPPRPVVVPDDVDFDDPDGYI
jgi:hypothetical protein